jgi:hypothetical protein
MTPHAEPLRDLPSATDTRFTRSVLVVDDENVFRDLMSRWLKVVGY